MFFACRPRSKPHAAFSLIESLSAVGLMATLMALVVPAIWPTQNAESMTRNAYEVAEVLENARAYALANNTYVWVGFYEEDAAKGNAVPGTGRIVLSTVASKDGTTIYNSKPESPATPIDPSRLTQIGKLTKVENVHLKTASASDPVFPKGSGAGDTFLTRPTVSGLTAQIGDRSPTNASLTPFQYPVGGTGLPAQYLFSKAIQFSPRGEVRVDNINYAIKPVVEIGLQPARGNAVDARNRNAAAVQVTGLLANVKVYRP